MSTASPSFFRTAAFTSLLVLSISAACSDSSNNPTGGSAPALSGTLTYHNDNMRTGQNLNESVLTPANVNTTFGLLFSIPVDGQIYAEPLYVSGLNIGGKVHNTVFVATELDSVYAFDADNLGPPLWHTSFINPPAGITTVSSADVNCTEAIVPEIGITSTPVIDPNSRTLYVVAASKENGSFFHRLHALDVATGTEKVTPVVIQGQVAGTGDGNVNGIVSFNSLKHLQRAALLLNDNVVYIAFASYCDGSPYHGWVFAYDAQTLAQVGIFNTTPNGGLGGIWQSGGGPAADANGNVFVMTGNGTFDGPPPAGNNDFGDSFLKLAARALTQSDFFTPFDQATLEATDVDLGSGSPLLLPDQSVGPRHLLVSAGKGQTVYLIDRDNMGQFNTSNNNQIVQSFCCLGSLFGTPAYFENTVYFLGAGDVLRAFSLSNGKLVTPPASHSTTAFGFPGATPVISANGASNGIVWALQTDQAGSNGPAVLHAYLAANVENELYNSALAPSGQDNPGPAVKFTVPTVINGKVYVGTKTQLSVFGLLP